LNPYESDRLLAEYLLFHYGNKEEIFGSLPGPAEALNFAERSVTELIDPALVPADAQALEVGCAVGRSAFELTRYATQVQALDYSHRFIEAAKTLKAHGTLATKIAVEGEVTANFTARVPDQIARDRVIFFPGDATQLPIDLTSSDIVLAANLLCRLPDPLLFLDRLPSLVKPGGQLLLTTPFTWLEEFTPKSNWIGGRSGGKSSFEALQALLAPNFELSLTRDLPFVIREHARKFQYSVALGSRWIRRR
jgi:putative 4-mercaptohistidine N1-methyltranferase